MEPALDAVLALEGVNDGNVGEAVGHVPEHVEGDGGRDAGEAEDLRRRRRTSRLMVVAAAAWMNLPKRVPVLAKPQEGTSMRKSSRALSIRSMLWSFIFSTGTVE